MTQTYCCMRWTRAARTMPLPRRGCKKSSKATVEFGLPWQTLGAFVRIATHPRVVENPLSGSNAWRYVTEWLAVPVVWIPPATEATAAVYTRLCEQVDITGNLVPDAQLAALAIEFGVELASADTDFMRFPGLRWINPLSA